MKKLSICECPRDAMQGLKEFIPTEQKIKYLNSLLKVGFDCLDFGSFVSPKAIPQLADTKEVLKGLELNPKTKMLAIVANLRGAEDACEYEEIDILGFPFSVSETFQQRNTNKSIAASLVSVQRIQELCEKHGKSLQVYLSMAFGNPYGDEWSADIVNDWAHQLHDLGINKISLADTIGVSQEDNISALFSTLIPALPKAEISAHLHSTPDTWHAKVDAAWKAGCKHFDSAIKGFGGCPMAKDDLTGNLATESLLSYAEKENLDHNLNSLRFESAINVALQTFPF